MITTVTANPSLDRTLHVREITLGAVNRATGSGLEPSGKGVNVSLVLHELGIRTTAVLPVGGASGRQLVGMLDELGLAHHDVAIRGEVRSNVSLVEADGTTTKVNEPGPELSGTEVAQLVSASLAEGGEGDWVAWCGSLPTGFGDDALAAAVAGARTAGRQVALDTSGRALAAVLSRPAGELPHLVKPNAEELAELAGTGLRTAGDVVLAARSLVARGVRTVLVSLGADGAVLVDAEVALHGWAPVRRVVNTVGAGDSFLAGYLAAGCRATAENVSQQDRLASALRFGAAAVEHEGTLVERPDQNRPVRIEPVDGARELNP